LRPRVVILSAFLTPFRSGAEACAEEVAARLQNEFDITIVTAKMKPGLPREDRLPSGVRVRRVGLGLPIDKWLFPFLAPFAARKCKPQIVHAVLESYAGLALAFSGCVIPTAKRLLTCQSTNTALLLGPIHKVAHRVTAISSVLVERAKGFGVDAVLIPNGIPLKEIEAERVRTPKVSGRMLFVGRLEEMKGVDTLLEAFQKLKVDSGKLKVVGGGSLRPSLERLATELGVSDRVTFTGMLSAPALFKEYAEAEVFVGLSRSEALGNVFLEAQAAGCVVVATNVGGIPDIVQDASSELSTGSVTGLLVPPDDPDAAAAAISKLLSDEGLRKRLADQGRENAKNYDWDGIAEKYEQEYRALLS
jgi:glycosyltransferase involved in cell wall biosynthesis